MEDADYMNRGRVLERRFSERLNACLGEARGVVRVYEEPELMERYGWNASSVDYLIELEHGIVVVQVKYRRTRRRENQAIRNFLNSAEHIKARMGKPVVFGLWVSRLEPFADNVQCLSGHRVVTVSYFENMDILVERAVGVLVNSLQKIT